MTRAAWAPTSRRAWRLALAGAVLLPVLVVGRFTSRGGFYSDDFVNFRQAQSRALSLDYLLEPTSAHFAPGHRLGDWLLQRFFPMNFGVAQAVLLVGFALSLLVFHRLLAELFGRGPAPVVLAFVYGLSAVHVGVIEWWASGLDRVPATLLSFASMLAYVRFWRTGSRGALAVSVAAMVGGLAFYVKPALVPLYLLLLRVLVLEPDIPVRRALADVQAEWRIWALYLVPVVLYLVVYVVNYGEAGDIRDPSVRDFATYLLALWFTVVAPTFFGIFVPETAPLAVTAVLVVAVQLGLLGGVVWSISRWKAAWRAWAFFAVGFGVNALLVGTTRVGTYGPGYISHILFYNLEIWFLSVIAVGAAVLPRSPPPAGDGRAAPPPAPGPRRRMRAPLLGLALGAYVVFAVVASNRVNQPDLWPGRRAGPYVERVRASLHRLTRSEVPAALADRTVPRYVVLPGAGMGANYSEVFPVIDPDVQFDVTGRQLFDIGEDGAARPVTFLAEGGGPASALLEAGLLTFRDATAEVAGDSVCMRSPGEGAVMAYTLETPLAGGELFVLARSSSPDPLVVGLVPEAIGTRRPGRSRVVRIQGASVVALDTPTIERVWVGGIPGQPVCMSELRVGRLVPRE